MAYLLLVDDDDDFASASAQILRNEGHEVCVELEIQNAVKSMEQRPPDLVILDVMFPESGTAGFDLARAMHHADSELKNIPILMLTAVNKKFPLGFSARDIDEKWLPVADFLEKPVDFDVLREKVAGLLERVGAISDTVDKQQEEE